MGNHSSRQAYFEEYNIDPYAVLELEEDFDEASLKRNYKQKAKKIHPDKTGGETKLEFQILHQCYLYLKEELKVSQQTILAQTATHNQLRERSREELPTIPMSDRPISSRHFDHKAFTTERNTHLLNNLDFDEHEKNMANKKLSREDINIIKALKDEKFDIEKFNVLFEYLNKDEIENCKKIVKYDAKPYTLEKQIGMNKVRYYNGILLATDEVEDTEHYELEKLRKSKETPNKSFEELVDNKTYTKLKKQIKKDTTKMQKKKAMDLCEKKREPISVNTKLSFKQAEEQILKQKLKEIQEEIEENKRFIKKNSRILPKELKEKAFKGLLEDSSQAIFYDKKVEQLYLQEPKGRRKGKN